MDSVEIRFRTLFEDGPIVLQAKNNVKLQKVFEAFAQRFGFKSLNDLRFFDPESLQRFWHNEEQPVSSLECRSFNDEFKKNVVEIEVYHEVCGGKGGFGSMLRTIGAQIEKTTNREACRDLSGRRMRDVEREKRMRAAGIKKAKTKVEEMAKKKEAAKKKLENLINNPGTSKEIIITEQPLIITDVMEKVDEDLAYFQEKKSVVQQDNSESMESSSSSQDSSTPEDSKNIPNPSEFNKNSADAVHSNDEAVKDKVDVDSSQNKESSNKKEDDTDDDDDEDDDADLGKNFWSGI